MMQVVDTFILVADDTKALQSRRPPDRPDAPTLAKLQYDLLTAEPYRYNLMDFLFEIHCRKQRLGDDERQEIRDEFYARGHACMRASPLTKTYGFGAHYDQQGRIAIYPMESDHYRKLASQPGLKVEKAMRNSRQSALATA
ncbi:hypothetical protein JJB09_11540 [Rhizobium sp. KVB221]|uniref:Uncharacterized protein n=1 Tax=Rhizobium setariae TaxID=2801340 RepID=A0A936YPX5_9HYPH|nr:DUF6157 family protein [Rhizobium setariae]MBL0372662.1 hypothetical protein [Rhizobium setariae]